MPLATKTYLTERHIILAIVGFLSLILPLGLLTPYPIVPFVLVAAIIWVFTAFYNPFAALIVYSIFILIRPHEWIPGMSFPMIEKAIVLPLIIQMIFKFINRRRQDIPFDKIDKAVTAFVLVTFLSIITSIWIEGAWVRFLDVFRLLIVYFLIAWNLDSHERIRKYIYLFILTGGFHAGASVINYYRGIRQYRMGIERAVGLGQSYADPNSLAASIIYTLPFLYFYFKTTKNRATRALFILIALVSLWCVILTGSRTGMLGIIFFAFMLVWQHRRNRLVAMIVGAAVLLIAFAVMPDQYRLRLESATDFSSESGAALSAQGRIDGLVNGVRMMIDRPLFGVGVGQYSIALGMVYGSGWWEAHSLPGQLFGDLGLAGTLAFTFWLFTLFKGLGYLKDYYSNGKTSGTFWYNMIVALQLQLLLLLFMGLGGHNLYRYNWFVISALVVAMRELGVRNKDSNAVDRKGVSH